jgi:high-affinity K+ transport system ATPase subunit B
MTAPQKDIKLLRVLILKIVSTIMMVVLCSSINIKSFGSKFMWNLRALVSILLLPTAISPLLLSSFAPTGVLLVAQAPAQAQSAEAVAKTAQAITVRIRRRHPGIWSVGKARRQSLHGANGLARREWSG